MALFVQLLDVPYHAQIDGTHCGPACAQMVLDHAGFGIDTQPNLYSNVCNSVLNLNWLTNPHGLAKTLSDRSMTALDATHVDRGFGDPVSATHTIVWTIAKHNRPPVAFVLGSHWVVVTGCILSDQPTAAYSPIALVLQDPLDTSAEDGGGNGQIDLVTYESWLADQFQNKVAISGDDFNKRWVVVGAGDAPDVNVQGPAPLAENAGPVDEAGAVSAARNGVQQEYVQAVDPIKVALDGTEPRGAIRVAQPGRQVPFVYVVPFYRDDRIPAAALIHADTGAFLGVRAIPGGSLAYPFGGALLSREGFLEYYKDGIPDPDTGERRSFDNATISDTPEWEPSAQSSSPYLPFWRVRYDGDQPYDLYVRLDGQVFTELTPAYG